MNMGANDGENIAGVDRLPEKSLGAFSDDFFLFSDRRNDEARNLRKRFVTLAGAKKLDSVHHGHHQVENDQARVLGFMEPFEGFFPIFECDRRITFELEHFTNRFANIRIIFDYDHGLRLG